LSLAVLSPQSRGLASGYVWLASGQQPAAYVLSLLVCLDLSRVPEWIFASAPSMYVYSHKIINFMNNEIKWKYSNNFKFRGDLTKMINGKVANCLDEVLLDEDIGAL
jgi:hypothetical protein